MAALNEIQSTTQRGIDAIDNNKHLFGGGTNAISRGYYKVNPLATESDEYRITRDIMALAQQDNLTNLASLLKGSFSDKDLAYVNKNMINENSSPAQIKRWLEHYERAARKAYEQQASSVNAPSAPSPAAPKMERTERVKKYKAKMIEHNTEEYINRVKLINKRYYKKNKKKVLHPKKKLKKQHI